MASNEALKMVTDSKEFILVTQMKGFNSWTILNMSDMPHPVYNQVLVLWFDTRILPVKQLILIRDILNKQNKKGGEGLDTNEIIKFYGYVGQIVIS